MGKRILLLSAILSLNAHAARTGTDERVYRCVADQKAEQLGAGEIFEVHVVHDREMTLTRQSDGLIIKAVVNNSGYYIYRSPDQGGYIGNVRENGRLDVDHKISQGHYARNILNCTQTKVISEYAPYTKTELALQDLGENAGLANGQYEFYAYDVKNFDLNKEWQKIEKRGRGWDSCTWTRLTDRKEILRMVKEDAYDPEAARKIKKLEREPGIAHMIGYKSDDDVSCSQRWVWLYTNDGYKLELEYSQGD